MSDPTIEDLKAMQLNRGMLDAHLVWLGDHGFVIAHTQEERETIDLEKCELHLWLRGLDGPPDGMDGRVERGRYYIVLPHEPDAYSEPLHADPWDFHGPIYGPEWDEAKRAT